ncbi:MAG: MFS transporter, partial [Pyrinomonadaceae bacterium]
MKTYDNDTHHNTETLFLPEIEASPETPIGSLADRMPVGAFVPFLIGAMILAIAYGSSFLLVDMLRVTGWNAAEAGNIISIGTIATLAGCVGAGRFAERIGILPLIICSAVMMACAMACFAGLGILGIGIAYAGGLLLGLGWSVFYILAPIQLIHYLKPAGRIEALTLLSGSQMLGI